MATPEGWRGWDDYAAFYDWENARTVGRRDLNFWRRFVRGVKRPVLELGCGTGRVLAPVARAGATAVGVDRSGAMLVESAGRLSRLPGARRPSLARADVRRLPFRSASFGRVIAAYGLLQSLLTDDDLACVLHETARVLEPGGRLGIDLVPDLRAWDEYRRQVRLRGRAPGGRHVTLIETVRQDRRRQMTVFDEEFVVRRGRQLDRRRFTLAFRTVDVDDMSRRLEAAGFGVDMIAGSYAGAPWTPVSDTWLIVAKKR